MIRVSPKPMPMLPWMSRSLGHDAVDGLEGPEDVQRRLQGPGRVVEDGEQVVGRLLDHPAAVADDRRRGRLLHLPDHRQVEDDPVLAAQPREAAHVQHQDRHPALEGRADPLVDLRGALGVLVPLREEAAQLLVTRPVRPRCHPRTPFSLHVGVPIGGPLLSASYSTPDGAVIPPVSSIPARTRGRPCEVRHVNCPVIVSARFSIPHHL